jgi:hypothetical protein
VKTRFALLRIVVVVTLLAALQPLGASACAICYGEPDSPMTNGLTWAILALALVVGCVLTGAVAFFVHASRGATNQATPSAKSGVTTTPT